MSRRAQKMSSYHPDSDECFNDLCDCVCMISSLYLDYLCVEKFCLIIVRFDYFSFDGFRFEDLRFIDICLIVLLLPWWMRQADPA